MTARRFLRAGALVMVGVACARPQAGTETASPPPPTTAQAAAPGDEAVVEEPLPDTTSADALDDAEQERGGAWDDLANALRQLPEAPAIRASAPTEALTERAVSTRDASDRSSHPWSAGPPRAEEPDDRREEQRLKAIAAAYRVRLRSLENARRFAEQVVQNAEEALSRARETPKTLGGPLVNNAPCVPDEPVVILPPPDIPSLVAAAEERLAQARDDLKRARDAEDDLFTKMRRERIPLSDVL